MARKADIIVSATGVTGLITPEMIKENSVLIDVGFTRKMTSQERILKFNQIFFIFLKLLRILKKGNIRLMGDIEPSCRHLASVMSPVPGGIGPLTIAHLCRNTLNAHLLHNNLPIMSLF